MCRVAGFDCTFLELDVIGDALGIDVRPFPFEFPVHGDLVEDRIRLIHAAERTLTTKGLVNGVRFAPEVEETLGLFARGRLAVAILGTVDGTPCAARAVTDDRVAVLAVQRSQMISFDTVTPASMIRAVLSLLPPARPGPGRSVTITAETAAPPRQPQPSDEDFGGRHYLQPARPTGDAASVQRAMIDEIMRRPRVGSGYFAATVRGRDNRESKPLTMNWLDTDSGRYVVIPTTGPDGRTHITYAPADQAKLEQSLTHIVRTLN